MNRGMTSWLLSAEELGGVQCPHLPSFQHEILRVLVTVFIHNVAGILRKRANSC